MHYALKDDDITHGFALDAEALGHEFFEFLEWAESSFEEAVVEQREGRVFIYSWLALQSGTDRLDAVPLDDREDRSTGVVKELEAALG